MLTTLTEEEAEEDKTSANWKKMHALSIHFKFHHHKKFYK